MRRSIPLLLTIALLLAACTADELDDAVDETFEEVPGSDVGEDDAATPAQDVITEGDLTVLELGPAEDGEVEVEVDADTVSLLFTAHGADPESDVAIFEIIAPDGTSITDPLELQPSNVGEHSVLIPTSPQEALQPGVYTFIVDGDGGIPRTSAVLKRGPLAPEQVIDVTFFIASTVALEAGQAVLDEVALIYRNAGEVILAEHGMGVGEIRFAPVDPSLAARFGELPLPSDGTDTAQRELCGALDDLTDGLERRLAFAIVDEVIDDVDPDAGETEGNAAGLPGATVVGDTVTDCVIMTADGSRDITELSATVWHEAGHLMGLAHTTEEGGDTFDLLDDTPECELEVFDVDDSGFVTFEECPDGDNLMFYDSDALAISPQQAFVLRHHPLLRPAP